MADRNTRDQAGGGGDFAIELLRDLGFRGVHLGKGYVMDGNVDRLWAEHLEAMGDVKRVPKPAAGFDSPPPWEIPVEPPVAAKHPTAPRVSADAKPEHKHR